MLVSLLSDEPEEPQTHMLIKPNETSMNETQPVNFWRFSGQPVLFFSGMNFGEPVFRFHRIKNESTISDHAESTNERVSEIHRDSPGCISERIGETIRLADIASHSSSSSLTITNCTDCFIVLDGPIGNVHLYCLRNCSVLFHAVVGSVNIGQSSHCDLRGFCSQLRISDASSIEVHVQTRSRTALVNCCGISIGPPPNILDEAWHKSLELADMNSPEFIASERWKGVDDFSLIKTTTSNWGFIEF